MSDQLRQKQADIDGLQSVLRQKVREHESSEGSAAAAGGGS